MAGKGVVALAAAAVVSAIGVGLAHPAAAAGGQVLVSDTFTGATTTSPIVSLSNTLGLPCLSAGTSTSAIPIPECANPRIDVAPDPGALRFTDLNQNEQSGIVYANDLPLAQGLQVDFKVYEWRAAGDSTNSADGILFALAAAPPGPTQLGPPGGFLGYGTDGPSGAGLPGGYLGVGFDTYGDFAAKVDEPNTCADPPGPRDPDKVPNAISVRGPGFGTTGYCLLATGGEDTTNFLAGSREGSEVPVRILIDPGSGTYTVSEDADLDTVYTTRATGLLPTTWYDHSGTLHTGTLPDRVTFVIAGATGFYDEYNEISDLTAVTLNGSVPVLTLTADDDHGGAITPGGAFSYVLRPRIDASGGAEADPTSLLLTATLPASTTLAATPTGTGWDCSASAGNSVSCSYTVAGPIPAGTDLPAVSVPVQVSGASIGDSLDIDAHLTSADAAQPVQAGRSVVVGAAPPPAFVPGGPADQHHNSEASNDQNRHVEGADATATTAQPTVTTPCSGACTLAARTTDTDFEITATDTAYHGTSVGATPTFALTINGGGRPQCPRYRTSDHDWVQFGFRANAGSTFEKNARMTTRKGLGRKQAERLLRTRQICFAAPYRFATRAGYAVGRGHGEFAGVLPDCGQASGPCIRSRKLVRVGSGWGVRIVFVVPPNKRDPKALG
jgi:hypothetical protein